ncbi:MAG: sugar phosphate isomerase/epimerase, partial [Gammaproteobacteria bacterium]|nr:sugar phosphate isomerase/epimerase [Gammaproteobacteria bacterium]
MQLLFAKSKWEAWHEPLPGFLGRTAEAGFDAVELFLPVLTETPDAISRACSDHGLLLIAQIVTQGDTLAAHRLSLEERYMRAAECRPLFVNCHTGSDAFTFEENLELFERAAELQRSAQVRIVHETHRSRALYNGPDTLRFLRSLPELRLTADLSHWQVVHESDDLARHRTALNAVVARADHVHARVGFSSGPQVPDPRAPEWSETLATATQWWQQIVDARAADGMDSLTITPEFGPPPYMPT